MRHITVLMVSLAFIASASAQEKYRDGRFVGRESVPDGFSCSGQIYDRGQNPATGEKLPDRIEQDCKPVQVTHYKISVGGYLYTVQYVAGYAIHPGVLVGAADGTAIGVRFDKNGETLHVKIGKRESRYRILPGTTPISR